MENIAAIIISSLVRLINLEQLLLCDILTQSITNSSAEDEHKDVFTIIFADKSHESGIIIHN